MQAELKEKWEKNYRYRARFLQRLRVKVKKMKRLLGYL